MALSVKITRCNFCKQDFEHEAYAKRKYCSLACSNDGQNHKKKKRGEESHKYKNGMSLALTFPRSFAAKYLNRLLDRTERVSVIDKEKPVDENNIIITHAGQKHLLKDYVDFELEKARD